MNKQEGKSWSDRFDKKFGYMDLDKDDMISQGRGAGCDDCGISQEIREEHKKFVEKEIELATYKAEQTERKRILEKVEKQAMPPKSFGWEDGQRTVKLSEVKKIIKDN